MSPSRRDLLRAAAGLGLAVLPFTTGDPVQASEPVPVEDIPWWAGYFRDKIEDGEFRGVSFAVDDGTATFRSASGQVGAWTDAAGNRHVVMSFDAERPISGEMWGTMFIVPLLNLTDK